MQDPQYARQIAAAIRALREHPGEGGVTVTTRGGCAACDPGACPVCGYLFMGEILQIEHCRLGRRVITDRAVHFLEHGVWRYETGYVVKGEPVIVEIDLQELGGYLDL